MRRLMLMSALVAVLMSLFGAFVSADDHAATEKPVTNKMCPMTSEAVDPAVRTEYEGQYVYFCCKGCVDKFNADPKAAVAKMSDADQAAIMKNTVCPISGEDIEHFDIRSEVNGRLLYFCCDHCKAKFDKEHPASTR